MLMHRHKDKKTLKETVSFLSYFYLLFDIVI